MSGALGSEALGVSTSDRMRDAPGAPQVKGGVPTWKSEYLEGR